MTHQARKHSESGFYHVTARGVGRQIIFEDDKDREHFVDAGAELSQDCNVEVLAWCLMDNHIHLLLSGELESISSMMRRLLGGYAMRFNGLHGRVGHLFQERFHSKVIESEEQLLATLRYIHLNPREVGADFKSYPWSSYQEYVSGRPRLASMTFIQGMLGTAGAFADLHESPSLQEAAVETAGGRVAGSDVERIAGMVLEGVSPYEVKALDRKTRDRLLAKLRDAGLSIRQVERLTGIGRGIISHAKM